MAGYRKDKTTVAQTALNGASEVAAALVGAGLIKTVEEADAYINSRFESTFALLAPIVDADNALFAETEAVSPAKSSGSKTVKASKPGATPGETEFDGGKFKGCTISEVYAMTEDVAKNTYGHQYGAGSTYILNYVATDKNTNPTTREAAKQFLAALEG